MKTCGSGDAKPHMRRQFRTRCNAAKYFRIGIFGNIRSHNLPTYVSQNAVRDVKRYASAMAALKSMIFWRQPSQLVPSICTARMAAFFAPLMATQATGTPEGI